MPGDDSKAWVSSEAALLCVSIRAFAPVQMQSLREQLVAAEEHAHSSQKLLGGLQKAQWHAGTCIEDGSGNGGVPCNESCSDPPQSQARAHPP